MNDGLLSLYLHDSIYIVSELINWIFQIGLLVLLYQVVDYLNYK